MGISSVPWRCTERDSPSGLVGRYPGSAPSKHAPFAPLATATWPQQSTWEERLWRTCCSCQTARVIATYKAGKQMEQRFRNRADTVAHVAARGNSRTGKLGRRALRSARR